MSQYTTGTVTTNGTATVTGSGTSWLSQVSIGDWFMVRTSASPDGGVVYTVGGVVSDTELTLTAPYGGANVSGAAYVIHRDFLPNGTPKIFPTDVETAGIFNEAMKILANRYAEATEANLGTLKISTLAAALAGTDENTAMPPDLVHAAFNQYGLGAEFPEAVSDANDINRPGFYRIANGVTGNVTNGAANIIHFQYDSDSRSQIQMRAGQTTTVEAYLVNFTSTGQKSNAEIYHERNVVGTTSQSGGVPTGAIIERGSNANGEYVKFADGTLEQWGEASPAVDFDVASASPEIWRSRFITVNLPVNFINADYSFTARVVSGSGIVSSVTWMSGKASGDIDSVSQVFPRFLTTSTSATTGSSLTFTWYAIGRWF